MACTITRKKEYSWIRFIKSGSKTVPETGQGVAGQHTRDMRANVCCTATAYANVGTCLHFLIQLTSNLITRSPLMSKRAARVSSEAGQQMECVLGHEELWSYFAPFDDHKPHVCAAHDGATHFETTPSPASPVRVIAHLYGSFAVKGEKGVGEDRWKALTGV